MGQTLSFPGEGFLDCCDPAAKGVGMIEEAPPVLRFERIVKIGCSLFVDSDLEIRLGVALHKGANNPGPGIGLGFVDNEGFVFSGLG